MNARTMVAGATAAAMLLPMAAFAQTTTAAGVQSQIQVLLQQIQALQQQLKTLVGQNAGSGSGWMGSSTNPFPGGMHGMGDRGEHGTSTGSGTMMPPGQIGKIVCVTLNRDLHIGDRGDDVRKMQDMLGQDPRFGFNASSTGFFGPMTARAMAKFQQFAGIASSSSGIVGPLTRGFFNRSCGEGLGGGKGGNGQGKSDGPGRGDTHGGMISGTISANSGGTLTVTNAAGQTKTVIVGTNTSIQVWNGTTTPPSAGNAGSLVIGDTIVAEGTINSDGSLQAAHIRVGFPAMQPMTGSGEGDHMGPPTGMMPIMGGEGGGHDGMPQNY